jgi:sarcosine dehydrogenase
VYDVLWEAGQAHGIVNAGYRAIDRLRVEKGYVYWSTDVTPDTTPLEAGLEWRIDWDKGDFCGRRALVAQRDGGIDRKLCTFTLEPPPGQRVYPVGGEPIILGDDVVGFTTTANFGDTIGKPIAYGYVPIEHLARSDWVIEVYGEAIPATRHEGALYDPKGTSLRA